MFFVFHAMPVSIFLSHADVFERTVSGVDFFAKERKHVVFFCHAMPVSIFLSHANVSERIVFLCHGLPRIKRRQVPCCACHFPTMHIPTHRM